MIKKIVYLAALVGATFAAQVGAATTWTLGTGTVSGVGDSTAVTASVQGGFANTVGTNTANNGYSQTIAAGTVTLYSGGLGIRNADWNSGDIDANEDVSSPPEHAIDNNERYDMLLLGFNNSVKLTQVQAGFVGTDSDITVMAYTAGNAAAAAASMAGKTWTALATTAGWVAIGNYFDGGTSVQSINAAGVFSSAWLIGAYNPLVNPTGTLASSDSIVGGIRTPTTFDYVKLQSVTGCISGAPGCVLSGAGAPEPGSLALFGLALVGSIAATRRKKVSRV